ncbi:hypothetical protein BC829DRAFT_440797 [Chytridium lagenaria]|nr:hypothetical protein BC829DRAFT_440797 [Chytridium lagenaria]
MSNQQLEAFAFVDNILIAILHHQRHASKASDRHPLSLLYPGSACILTGKVDPSHRNELSAPAWIFDGDIDNGFNPKSMHDQGKKAVCYINVGAIEVNGSRSDESLFPSSVMEYPIQAGPNVSSISDAGCDAIEPDNTETYITDTGFNLTLLDALDYIDWMATEIRGLGMSVALKNGAAMLERNWERVMKSVDFAVVEGCALQKTCGVFVERFVKTGKAVFVVEYTDSVEAANEGGCEEGWSSETAKEKICGDLNGLGVEGFIKGCDLKGDYRPCQTYVEGVRAGAAVPTIPKKDGVTTTQTGTARSGERGMDTISYGVS